MPAPTFEEFCGDFRQFRAMLGNILQKASDGPMKQQLADAVKTLDEQFKEALNVYPQARAELQALELYPFEQAVGAEQEHIARAERVAAHRIGVTWQR